jgi:hypothetical protein
LSYNNVASAVAPSYFIISDIPVGTGPLHTNTVLAATHGLACIFDGVRYNILMNTATS